MENKKILPKIYIALWMALLVALGVYYLGFAPREAAYSETENRMLNGFPEVSSENIFSGNFSGEFENYLLDHFPYRNAVTSAVKQMQNTLSFASYSEHLMAAEDVGDPLVDDLNQEDLDALLAELNQTEPPHTEPEPADTQPTEVPVETEPVETEPVETEPVENPPITPKPAASVEDFPETLRIYADTGSGLQPLREYGRYNVAATIAVLNKYAQLLPENGKLMFTLGLSSFKVNTFVTAENKISMYSEWDEMVTALSADNVYAIDSAEILGAAIMEGEYVAFRTDNHWTPRGAYMVYRSMAEKAGKVPSDYYEDFEISYEENFRGTYVRDYPDSYVNVESDTLALLMPKVPVEWRKLTNGDEYVVTDFLNMNAIYNDRYTVYLGGPGGPWKYVECDNDQTENCLVLTDSFGLTCIPFLTTNYKQIHYYDPRFYSYNVVQRSVAEMIEEYNIHDIYVISADFNAFSSTFLIQSANYHLTMGK